MEGLLRTVKAQRLHVGDAHLVRHVIEDAPPWTSPPHTSGGGRRTCRRCKLCAAIQSDDAVLIVVRSGKGGL